VSAATQVYYASFDAAFFKLPSALRARIEAKIDEIGSRLASYPHHRLKGSNRYRLASATTGSFMPSTWRRTGFLFSPLDIGERFTGFEPRPSCRDASETTGEFYFSPLKLARCPLSLAATLADFPPISRTPCPPFGVERSALGARHDGARKAKAGSAFPLSLLCGFVLRFKSANH